MASEESEVNKDSARTTYEPGLGYAGFSDGNSSGAPYKMAEVEASCSSPTAKSRYVLSPRIAARIERLAQSQYVIRKLTDADLGPWAEVAQQGTRLCPASPGNTPLVGLDSAEEILEPIAQSVFASSAIEGEAVHRDKVKIAIVGHPDLQSEGEHEPNEIERIRAIRSIYAAYIWALSCTTPLDGNRVVTPEFVCEIHKRMFESTRGDSAGRFKTQDNFVKSSGALRVMVRMLPFAQVPEFLSELCGRINRQFQEADEYGWHSKLLATAEFVSDFLAVHPFADGNGRLARLLSTYLLENAGYHFARFYALDAVILERRADYYAALFNSQRALFAPNENMTPWIEFYTECIYEQWRRAHSIILSGGKRRPSK